MDEAIRRILEAKKKNAEERARAVASSKRDRMRRDFYLGLVADLDLADHELDKALIDLGEPADVFRYDPFENLTGSFLTDGSIST